MFCRNHLYDALAVMVSWTQNVIKENKFSYHSPLAFLKEFATVKYNLPRKSGHTTMAKKLYREKFKNNAIIIVPFQEMRTQNFNTFDKVYNIDNLSSLSFYRNIYSLNNKVEAIIVDCSSLFTKTKIEKIYEFVIYICKEREYNNYPVLIFLQ